MDTATEACSAALWVDGEISARFVEAGRHHTEQLLPMVDALLADAQLTMSQIDAFACGIGPGSFVGVRIAVGVCKGLALALDRPCVARNSLQTIADQCFTENAGASVAVALDARMGELYYARYSQAESGASAELSAPCVGPPDMVEQAQASDFLAGRGWLAYPALPQAHPQAQWARDCELPQSRFMLAPAAQALATQQGLLSADQLEPMYLRNQVALTLKQQRASKPTRTGVAP